MARKPLTPEQCELISRRTREAMSRPEIREQISERTREAMSRPEVREKILANKSPERRELIARRTREAMQAPEIRERIRAGTRRGMAAAEAIVSDEIAALRCAWRSAGAKARRRFLGELTGELCGRE
jgi:hypothetical protein